MAERVRQNEYKIQEALYINLCRTIITEKKEREKGAMLAGTEITAIMEKMRVEV